jgi:Cytosol aminopeptidase family, N-terminal domain
MRRVSSVSELSSKGGVSANGVDVVADIRPMDRVVDQRGEKVRKLTGRRKLGLCLSVVAMGILLFAAGSLPCALIFAQTASSAIPQRPAELQVSGAPIATRVLVQSPAETDTELQIVCLFASEPQNALHGALLEMNEKLKGVLDKIRKPALFRGELGETLRIVPPAASLVARNLLVIGLGDSTNFTPQRMELVGAIVYREANRLGAAHPFFAPTILDGGVTKFTTGEVAEHFFNGFLRADRTEKLLKEQGVSPAPVLQDLTYLAGPSHALDTQQGLGRALANLSK